MFMLFFFLMIRRPPRSTLFPTRRSSDLICPSEATKAATMRLFGVEAARCRVIPHGVETELDRKSTRLNSSHSQISYAVFCLKKKNSISGSHYLLCSFFFLTRCLFTTTNL